VLGNTTFDIAARTRVKETNGINLITDGMLALSEDLAGPTAVAVTAAGVVRDDIVRGRTGALTFADLYRVLPLGKSPGDGSPGYPLLRFTVMFVELKAAMEISAQHIGGGYFLMPSGIHVYYDADRPPQVLSNPADALDPQNGRITKITLDSDHSNGTDDEDVVLFDITRTGSEWVSPLGDQFTLYWIVTNYYIAQFAAGHGISLKDGSGRKITIDEAILTWSDGRDVKDYEAFMGYVRTMCQGNGSLPSRYDSTKPEGTVPRRMVCQGSACP